MSTVLSVHKRTFESLKDSLSEKRIVEEALQYLFRHVYLIDTASAPCLQTVIDKTTLVTKIPIARPSVDLIELVKGGVIGDSYLFPPVLLPNGLIKRRVNEVNIFTIEELTRLNLLMGTTVPPGGVGENIITSGINIDSLPVGTLLGIGSAVVRVAGRRSFCWKFVGTFIKKDFYKPNDIKKFNSKKIGVATQTVTDGIVKPGDLIQVIKLGSGPCYKANKLVRFELFESDSDVDPILPF